MAPPVEHVRSFGTGPDGLLFTHDSNEPIRRDTSQTFRHEWPVRWASRQVRFPCHSATVDGLRPQLAGNALP
jgi:hypothetical protein